MRDRVMNAHPRGCPNPIPLLFHDVLLSPRFDALPVAFRVAGFGRADLTTFPSISPAPRERCTALLLTSCRKVYFLSALTMRAAHTTVNANANQTVRLMAFPYAMLHGLIQVHQLGDLLPTYTSRARARLLGNDRVDGRTVRLGCSCFYSFYDFGTLCSCKCF